MKLYTLGIVFWLLETFHIGFSPPIPFPLAPKFVICFRLPCVQTCSKYLPFPRFLYDLLIFDLPVGSNNPRPDGRTTLSKFCGLRAVLHDGPTWWGCISLLGGVALWRGWVLALWRWWVLALRRWWIRWL